MGKTFNLDQQSELFIMTNKTESIYSDAARWREKYRLYILLD